jgi:hypothetical protein
MNITPTCEIAGILSIIEKRLRDKSKLATSDFLAGGYAQASLEIARENLEHFRQCELCRRIEATTASDWRGVAHVS